MGWCKGDMNSLWRRDFWFLLWFQHLTHALSLSLSNCLQYHVIYDCNILRVYCIVFTNITWYGCLTSVYQVWWRSVPGRASYADRSSTHPWYEKTEPASSPTPQLNPGEQGRQDIDEVMKNIQVTQSANAQLHFHSINMSKIYRWSSALSHDKWVLTEKFTHQGFGIQNTIGGLNFGINFISEYSNTTYDHLNGLVQERHNSIANALELCLSYTNPSTFSQFYLARSGSQTSIFLSSPWWVWHIGIPGWFPL